MKMTHLIVVPRIVNRVGDWYQFPLGIAYVSASLRQAGFRLRTLNLNNEPGSVYDALRRAIAEPDVGTVLTGGLTGQYGAIKQILEEARKLKPDIVTIVGGGIVTSAPEHAMQALEVADYGVIGEGELTSCRLCAALEDGTDTGSVPGIIIRNGTTLKRTEGRAPPVDVDRIPFPDYQAFGLDALLQSAPNIIGMCERNTLPIITSRGCPFRCTFCFHPSGDRFRQRSLDSVFAEIDYLVREYGVRYLSIQDELFGHDLKRVREFCRRITPYGIKWLAQFRVSDVTPELVAMLKAANCATMGFGVESADNRVLRSMKKRITVEQTERALELVYQAGIGIQGVLIFGDVAETRETAQNTINWWKQHIHYELQLSAVIAYPGTEVYDYARAKGIIRDPVQYIKDGCPIVRLSDMPDEDYSWLFEQLASLPRLTHKTPEGARIAHIDYRSASVDVVGGCVSCHAENHWEKVRLFILETLACQKCGRKHIAPIPPGVVDRINAGVARLVAKYGKIAFWGINSYFYALAGKLGPYPEDAVLYVDKSDVRRAVRLSGHVIQPPEVIAAQGVRCVVVSVPQYFAGLKEPIEAEYPGVREVLSIADLLVDDAAPRPQSGVPQAP